MAKQISTNNPIRFSVVIIVKNDRGIDSSLQALKSQIGTRSNCEVIVVDASKRSALLDISLKYPWVKWQYFTNTTGKRITIPEQRNQGIAAARGDIIIFLDANCIPAPKWLSIIESAFKSSGCSAITGPIKSVGDNKLHDAGYTHYKDDQPMTECGAANLAVRESILNELNGFDEHLSYGEDVDLTWRVRKAGYSITFKKDMTIAHDWGSFLEDTKRAYRYGTSRTTLFKKHPDQLHRLIGPDINALIYPVFILCLPITIWIPLYPGIILIPILKNLRNSPIQTTILHLVYGVGLIKGTFKAVQ